MNLTIQEQRAIAFDYIFDAVVVTDLEGIIVDWNKGSEKLYGYTKDQAIGQPVNILHVPEDTQHITEEVISAVATHGKWSGEVRSLHKNGHIGWIESMCVPIFDDKKQMIGALGINRDITGRIEEKTRLIQLANYDQLTGIPNRFMLLDRVSRLIHHSNRYDANFGLLYIDLDDFKTFNDSYGHAYGDKILINIATKIKESIRASDTIARIGGDEFILLLEEVTHKDDIIKRTDSLRSIFNQPIVIDNIENKLSCSIGVAIYPEDGADIDTLLAVADKAMYQNKDS